MNQLKMRAALLLVPLVAAAASPTGCPAYPFMKAVPFPAGSLPQAVQDALSSVNASLSAMLSTPGLPGFAFSASYAGQPLATFAGGIADLSNPSAGPVDPYTALFRVASNTKLFMATLTYIFHQKGYLRLDDPVNLYAPGFSTMPWDDGFIASSDPAETVLDLSNVTFRMLASHTSGLPDSLPGQIDWTNITTAEAFAQIAQTPLQNPLYGFPAYSNLGVAVLGHLLSEFVAPQVEELKGMGTDLASLLNRFIIGPLGLNHTGYNYTADVQKALTPGYYSNGQVVGIHSLGWAAPAGVMYSTVVDLQVLFQTLASCSSSIVADCTKLSLTPALARQFLQPVTYLPDGSLIVGSPWETLLLDGYVVRSKSGTLDGYSTKSAVLPELRLSFSFTFNGNFPNWYAGDGLLRQVASTLIPAVQQAITPLQPGRPVGPLASTLAGNYTWDGDSTGQVVAVVALVNAGGSIGQQLQITITGPGAPPQVNVLGYAASQGQAQAQLYRLYQTGFTSQNCEHLFMQDTSYGWPVVFAPVGSSSWSLAISDWTGSWTRA